MKAAVITFPGSNCDRDLAVAFAAAGFQVARVWHKVKVKGHADEVLAAAKALG